MRLLHFFKPLRLVVLLLAAPTGHAAAQVVASKASVQALDTKNGFRDVRFGTPLSAFSGLTLYKDGPDRKMYLRKNENLKLGKYSLIKVVYTFYHGKLSAILCTTAGVDNLKGIRQALEAAYGAPNAPGIGVNGAAWKGRVVEMSWMPMTDTQAFISLESIPLQQQREADDKRAVQTAADALK